MPIYEYQCPWCGQEYELLRALCNRDSVVCECGTKMTRKLSVVNSTFGWRLTAESHNVKGHKDELERDI